MSRNVISLIVAGLTVSSTLAAVLRVPSQYSTIQAGINAAVYNDTVLIADGTYTGAGNRDIDFHGRAIVVMSECGPLDCIIDCDSSGRGFYFHSQEDTNSVVDGFSIINGYAINGAGVYCNSSSPTIVRCIISNCQCASGGCGGGIRAQSGHPRIINCTIYANDAPLGYGGGISSNASDIVISSCIIYNNTADQG